MKRFIAVILVLAIATLACGNEATSQLPQAPTVPWTGNPPTPIPLPMPAQAWPGPNSAEEQALRQNELEWKAYWESKGVISEPIPEDVKAQILADFANPESNFGSGEISATPDGFMMNVTASANVLVPVFTHVQQAGWANLYQQTANTLSAGRTLMDVGWFSAFHWTHHLQQAGISEYNLTLGGQWLSQIVQGAQNGGIILFRPANGAYGDAYIFVSRINGQQWATLLSTSGAPITTFNTGLASSVYKEKEALRYLSTLAKQGAYAIQSSDLPEEITANWNNGSAPIWRLWSWAAAYQLQLYAVMAKLTVLQAAEVLGKSIMDPIFLVPIPCFMLPGCGPADVNA